MREGGEAFHEELVGLRECCRGLGDGVHVAAEVFDLAAELVGAGEAEDGAEAAEGEETGGNQ